MQISGFRYKCKIIKRFTVNAIRAKMKQRKNAIENGVMRENESCILALNGFEACGGNAGCVGWSIPELRIFEECLQFAVSEVGNDNPFSGIIYSDVSENSNLDLNVPVNNLLNSNCSVNFKKIFEKLASGVVKA